MSTVFVETSLDGEELISVDGTRAYATAKLQDDRWEACLASIRAQRGFSELPTIQTRTINMRSGYVGDVPVGTIVERLGGPPRCVRTPSGAQVILVMTDQEPLEGPKRKRDASRANADAPKRRKRDVRPRKRSLAAETVPPIPSDSVPDGTLGKKEFSPSVKMHCAVVPREREGDREWIDAAARSIFEQYRKGTTPSDRNKRRSEGAIGAVCGRLAKTGTVYVTGGGSLTDVVHCAVALVQLAKYEHVCSIPRGSDVADYRNALVPFEFDAGVSVIMVHCTMKVESAYPHGGTALSLRAGRAGFSGNVVPRSSKGPLSMDLTARAFDLRDDTHLADMLAIASNKDGFEAIGLSRASGNFYERPSVGRGHWVRSGRAKTGCVTFRVYKTGEGSGNVCSCAVMGMISTAALYATIAQGWFALCKPRLDALDQEARQMRHKGDSPDTLPAANHPGARLCET